MMQAMQALQQMQAKVAETEAKLAAMSVTEVGGEGILRVTADGKGTITAVEIDEQRLKGESKEVIEDLLLTTINRVVASAETMKTRAMAEATQGLMPNLPGMFGK